MMKPLRRRHLQVWITLAVLLPASIIIAWLSVPRTVSQILLQPGTSLVLPIVLKKAEKENFTVSIRSNENHSVLQLEWLNKAALQYPTATIYAANKSNKNINDAKLIGRIEARGNWYFPLDSTFKAEDNNHFILYDFIHGQIIDSINLQP